MVAALWQGTYNRTNMDLIQALQDAGSQSERPDEGLGYGIPDYYKAFYRLSDGVIDTMTDQDLFMNTADDLNIITRNQLFNENNPDKYYIKITNLFGEEVYSREEIARTDLHRHNVQYWDRLPSGSYHIFIRRGRDTYNMQVMKGRNIEYRP